MFRSHRSAVCIQALAFLFVIQGGGMAAFAQSIPWLSGPAKLQPAAADLEKTLSTTPRSTDGSLHVVVQFDRPADKNLRAEMRSRGIEVQSYVGANAYFAKLANASADVAAIASTPAIVGISPLQSQWKMHPSLIAGDFPEWTVIPATETHEELVAVYAVFHGDIDLEGTARSLAESHSAIIKDEMPSINGLVLEMPAARVSQLVQADAVQWIEPALPQMGPMNDQAREVTQVDTLQDSPYGLNGDGVTVMVFDGGTVRSTHVDFEDRVYLGDSSSMEYHATHVAGTIGGAGIANPLYKGMAPAVSIVSYGFEVGGSGGLYSNPGDLEGDYQRAIGDGAILTNNSIGNNIEASTLPCEWQGNYGVTASLIDGIVGGSLGMHQRVIWAAGNERTGSRCDVEGYGDFYSIPPPCCAKNQVSIGAVNSDELTVCNFSSFGPTDDGRLKPDICAPGSQRSDDWGITSCDSTSDTAYRRLSGTSMACPVVTGISALFLQDFQAQFPGQALPRNSTLKAIYAQTAQDLVNTGPDYQTGYGFIQGEDAILLMRNSGFTEGSLEQGASYVRTLQVANGDPEFKVTLAWDDVPGTPNVAPALVNDLDLRVTDPNGVRHYPWTLDPLNPSLDAVQTAEDHLNNIEQVLVENPIEGEWTIEVYGYNVPQGPQTFSLAGNGALNATTFFTLLDSLPSVEAAEAPIELGLTITSYNETITAGSELLHFRIDGGAYQAIPLTQVGAGEYTATLPACSCGQAPEFYFSVEGSSSGLTTLPLNGATTPYSYEIGSWTPLVEDSFETDLGWTVDAGAYSGNWERADPEEVIYNGIIQPGDDHTPGDGNLCYVTGPLAGVSPMSYDVDGGPSHLTSPVFDLAGQDTFVSYWFWFHISVQMDDSFLVYVTNNGVDWVLADENVRSEEEWRYSEWLLSDFVEPTSTVQIRFTAWDAGSGSLMEALVDDFSLQTITCGAAMLGDIDADQDVDLDDCDLFVGVLLGTNTDADHISRSDINADGSVNGLDIQSFVPLLLAP